MWALAPCAAVDDDHGELVADGSAPPGPKAGQGLRVEQHWATFLAPTSSGRLVPGQQQASGGRATSTGTEAARCPDDISVCVTLFQSPLAITRSKIDQTEYRSPQGPPIAGSSRWIATSGIPSSPSAPALWQVG